MTNFWVNDLENNYSKGKIKDQYNLQCDLLSIVSYKSKQLIRDYFSNSEFKDIWAVLRQR